MRKEKSWKIWKYKVKKEEHEQKKKGMGMGGDDTANTPLQPFL